MPLINMSQGAERRDSHLIATGVSLPSDSSLSLAGRMLRMVRVRQEAMKNSEFRKIARTAEYSCMVDHPSDISRSREVTWTSGNAFYNGKFSFADNMEILCGKTGHTNAAGFCLVLGEKDAGGGEYVSIIMNSPIYEQMYVSMRKLAEKSQQ